MEPTAVAHALAAHAIAAPHPALAPYAGLFSFDEWRFYFDVTPAAVAHHLLMALVPFAYRGAWLPRFVRGPAATYCLPAARSRYTPELYTPLLLLASVVALRAAYAACAGDLDAEATVVGAAVLLLVAFVVSVATRALLAAGGLVLDVRDALYVFGMGAGRFGFRVDTQRPSH